MDTSNETRVVVKLTVKDPVKLKVKPVIHINRIQAEMYTGATTVMPNAFEDTVLETKNKHVSENIKVKKIPYFEVGSTVDGGNVVYIAGEPEIEISNN